MMTTQPDLANLYTVLTTLLDSEKTAARPVDLASWQGALARRAVLAGYLRQIEHATTEMRRRLDMLPALAHPEHVRWAQALLALPALAFLEVDTDGLGPDADVLRIALVDRAGSVLFDQVCRPANPISPKIAYLTGLTQEHLADAPRLADVWEPAQAALAGHYVLSFNLEFDQQQLTANARRWDLHVLTFIGECLMLRAQEYYGASSYPKLADLCARLGRPLPDHPRQDALDRARGQVHLLHAMAQGITHQVPDEATSHEADDPFLPDFPDENE